MENGVWSMENRLYFLVHVRLSEWTFRQAPGRDVNVPPDELASWGADELSCKTQAGQTVLAHRMAHTSAARCDQVRRWRFRSRNCNMGSVPSDKGAAGRCA